METPKVPASNAMRFRVMLRTRWSDEDNQCVLNNAVYSTLFEETRYAYFTHLGLLADNHFPFVLAQSNILFVSPGRGGAEIEAEVATVQLGTSSFTQAYRLREHAPGPSASPVSSASRGPNAPSGSGAPSTSGGPGAPGAPGAPSGSGGSGGSGGIVWCEAESRLVAWDNSRGIKVPMPAAFRARVAEFEGLR